MRHAEVRVSAKEDSSMDHGRRRKSCPTSHAAAQMADGFKSVFAAPGEIEFSEFWRIGIVEEFVVCVETR